MGLEWYIPSNPGKNVVSVDLTSFQFASSTVLLANLKDITWVRVAGDADTRTIVFQPVLGMDKKIDLLKLQTQRKGKTIRKLLTAKGFINRNLWINKVARLEDKRLKRFELKKYESPLPPLPVTATSESKSRGDAWYIQLMPAFENSVTVDKISGINSSAKGIYRYWGGNSGEKVVYIGKGFVRDRFQSSPGRKEWGVKKIEYSLVANDDDAYKWESFWIEEFQRDHGHKPPYNKVRGHEG